MSSYIVENKTINKIVSWLFWNNDVILKDTIKSELKKLGKGFDLTLSENCEVLGLAMIKLNCEAVSQRYDEKIYEKAINGYKYEDIKVTELQALKALVCFIYQCSEGDVPKRKLYKVLSRIETHMFKNIVYKMPKFEAAKWG